VADASEFLLTEQKQSQEARLQKKGKHAFHRQRLADHAACRFRKRRPVRSELKFHRNARDHAHSKVDPEDPPPKSRCAVVVLIARAQRFRLQIHKQQREAHRQLRKNVMKRDREREVQPVHIQCLFHASPRETPARPRGRSLSDKFDCSGEINCIFSFPAIS